MKKILLGSLMIFLFTAFLTAADDARLARLQDRKENPFARQAMAKLLVKDKVPGVGPILEEIFKDTNEDAKMRSIAVKYLGEMGDKDAGPAIVDTVKNKDESMDFRKACMESLGTIADRELLITLGAGISSIDDASYTLSTAYIAAVEKSKYIRDPEILVILGQFLSPSVKPDLKKRAVAALAESTDKSTITILMISLNDKLPNVRKEGLKALARLAGASAVTLFISKLEEEKKDDIRAMYAEELNKLPIPKLKKIWIEDLAKRVEEEKKPATKKRLAEALDRIKKEQGNSGTAGDTAPGGQKEFTASNNSNTGKAVEKPVEKPKLPVKK